MRLLRYQYKVLYVPGKLLATADTLSRAPDTKRYDNCHVGTLVVELFASDIVKGWKSTPSLTLNISVSIRQLMVRAVGWYVCVSVGGRRGNRKFRSIFACIGKKEAALHFANDCFSITSVFRFLPHFVSTCWKGFMKATKALAAARREQEALYGGLQLTAT